MKVIVNESLGLEYTWDVISSCDQNGMQAIADNQNNEILFYDPKNRQYCTNKDLMNADFSIHDVFTDKSARDQVMKPTSGKGFEDFATKWDALQKSNDPDVIKTKNCSMIRFSANEGRKPKTWKKIGNPKKDDGLSQDDLDFLDKLKNTDDKFGRRVNGIEARFSESSDSLWDIEDFLDDQEILKPRDREFVKSALRLRWGIEDVIDTDDPDWDEAWDDVHSELMLMYGNGHWHENCQYNEGDSKDMKEDDYDSPTDDNDPEEYKDPEEYEDDPNDWSASEDEVEIQWMIDDEELGIVSGSTETVVIDLGLVDCFEELVYQVTNALEKEYGMPFDYDDEWIFVDEDNLLKRFGYNMNESGSNGGVIDVTLKFTNGHYGKKLKAGDERTIKLDTSTAPTIYDQDDMLTWIADVASDQVPGGGCFTKYSFETIDPPDDVLIKAVMGDEGFGPDIDVDFEDFEPEDVPSEISYGEAVRFYKKMHDAYDDHKLDYTKYDKIRDKLMDAIVKGLLKEKSLDELADEWFINYGTMNGWDWKTSFKYNVACALHEIHKKKHPDEHVTDREDTVRGWHSEKCSCGLASSSDSSD